MPAVPGQALLPAVLAWPEVTSAAPRGALAVGRGRGAASPVVLGAPCSTRRGHAPPHPPRGVWVHPQVRTNPAWTENPRLTWGSGCLGPRAAQLNAGMWTQRPGGWLAAGMEQGQLWHGAEVRYVGGGRPGLPAGPEGLVEQLPGDRSVGLLTSEPMPRGVLLIGVGGQLWPVDAADLELISPVHPLRGEPDGSLADWLLRSLAPFRWVEGRSRSPRSCPRPSRRSRACCTRGVAPPCPGARWRPPREPRRSPSSMRRAWARSCQPSPGPSPRGRATSTR